MKYFAKKICSVLFFPFLSLALFASEISVSVSPQPLVKGQRARLELTSSQGEIELLELPEIDGIKWLGKGGVFSQTQIINFEVTKKNTVAYNFLVEKEGEIKFPALKVKVGRKKTVADPFTVEVVSPKIELPGQAFGSEDGLEKYLFIRAVPLLNRSEFYVGEEIPFEIVVYSASGIRSEYSWPEINAQNIIFRDFSQVNRENAKFAGYYSGSETIDGRSFNSYRFRTVFRSLDAGALSGDVKVNTRIRIPGSRSERRHNPFFDNFFFNPFSDYEIYEHTLSCALPELKIQPLPEIPNDSVFTGLVGDWNISYEAPEDKFKTGESFTLKVNIEGFGGIDNLRPPELRIEGFRIFPPEMVRHSNASDLRESAALEYLVVPLKEGESEIRISLLSFSSPEKEYKSWDFLRKIKVEKGDDHLSSAIISGARPQDAKRAQIPQNVNEETADILYLKKTNHGAVILPIWRNRIAITTMFLLAGPLLLSVCELLNILSKRKMSPEALRKREAVKRKNSILKKIKNLEENEANKFVREIFCQWLNDLKSYPPGTSPEELVKLLEDKELSEIIGDAASSAFMPSSSKINFGDKKRRLYDSAKKLAVIVVILFAALSELPATDIDSAAEISIKQSPYELFDRGNFSEAISAFTKGNPDAASDPYILYNIGCSFYRLGKLLDALYFFEKANLLLPRDSDILENLNYTRRRLGIREKGLVESPTDMLIKLKNFFRPDEWLLLASICICAFFVIISLRRRMAFECLCALLSIVILAGAIAIFAALKQFSGEYSGNSAIIYSKAANIFVLPSDKSEQLNVKLGAGHAVRIVEQRSDWTRVRISAGEGWIRNEDIRKIWD